MGASPWGQDEQVDDDEWEMLDAAIQQAERQYGSRRRREEEKEEGGRAQPLADIQINAATGPAPARDGGEQQAAPKRRLPTSFAAAVGAGTAAAEGAPHRAPGGGDASSSSSSSSRPAGPGPPLLRYPCDARIRYAASEADVDALCAQALADGPAAVGFDIEWRVLYRRGEPPRRAALIQLCYAPPAGGGGYVCLLLHVYHSGLPPRGAAWRLLAAASPLKVGVGIGNDALKLHRDYGAHLAGLLCLSELANSRALPPAAGSSGGAAPAAPTEQQQQHHQLADAARADREQAEGTGSAVGAPEAALPAALPPPPPVLPFKWSLSGLTQQLLGGALAKDQALRCGNWKALPLSRAQVQYAATNAWASLRVYEVLAALPNRTPYLELQPAAVPAEAPPLGAAAPAERAPCSADAEGLVPALPAVLPLQPAKQAVYELHTAQGLALADIAAARGLQPSTAQSYLAEAVEAGHAYHPARLGVRGPVLQRVWRVAQALLLAAPPPDTAAGAASKPEAKAAIRAVCPGPLADLQARGVSIKDVRLALLEGEEGETEGGEDVPYGLIRLCLAHIGRTGPPPDDGA